MNNQPLQKVQKSTPTKIQNCIDEFAFNKIQISGDISLKYIECQGRSQVGSGPPQKNFHMENFI